MVYNRCYAGVLELADEVDSKSIGSNTVRVQVPPPAPRRSKFRLLRFFHVKKSIITLRHSSSFVKGHVRVSYSFASALIKPLALYQPFERAKGTLKFDFTVFFVKSCKNSRIASEQAKMCASFLQKGGANVIGCLVTEADLPVRYFINYGEGLQMNAHIADHFPALLEALFDDDADAFKRRTAL